MDPATLKFAKTHEWVRVEGDVATVGISDFAVKELTDIVHLELPRPGRSLSAGEVFGEIESVKAVSDLYAPVAGEIIETNEDLENELETLSDDPYGQGWIIKVRLSGEATLDHLMDAAAYRSFCESESH